MNLKLKLTTLCSMLAAVISFLVVGVWSLVSIGMNIGGDVSYSPPPPLPSFSELRKPSYDFSASVDLNTLEETMVIEAFSYTESELFSCNYFSDNQLHLDGLMLDVVGFEESNTPDIILSSDEVIFKEHVGMLPITSNYLVKVQLSKLFSLEIYPFCLPLSPEYFVLIGRLLGNFLDNGDFFSKTGMASFLMGFAQAEIESGNPMLSEEIANQFPSIGEIVSEMGVPTFGDLQTESEFIARLLISPELTGAMVFLIQEAANGYTPAFETMYWRYFELRQGEWVYIDDITGNSVDVMFNPDLDVIVVNDLDISKYFNKFKNINTTGFNYSSSYDVVDGNIYSYRGSSFIRLATLNQESVFELPASVDYISEGAFNNADYLKYLYIDQSQVGVLPNLINTRYSDFTIRIKCRDYVSRFDLANYIQQSAHKVEIIYQDQSGLNYVEENGGFMVSGYTGTKNNVVIPDSYTPNGGGPKPVIGIKSKAFNGNSAITEIGLPSSLKYIENNAFAGIPNVKEIDFGNARLNSYGSDVFGGRTDVMVFAQNKDSAKLIKDSTANSTSVDMTFFVESADRDGGPNRGVETLSGNFSVEFKVGSNIFKIDTIHSLSKFTDKFNGYMIVASKPNETLDISLKASIDAEITGGFGTNLSAIDHIQEQIAIGRIEKDGTVTFLTGTPKDQTYFNHPGGSASVSYPKTGKVSANVGDDLQLVVNFTVMTYVQCFTEGTLVTLADGSTKAIEDVTYDDLLLVWDFDRGEFGYSYPVWIAKSGEYGNYYLMKFDDGSEVEIVLSHRLFNTNNLSFEKSIDALYSQVGQQFFRQTIDENGNPIITTPTCVSIEKIEETCTYYNMVTSQSLNFFANGFLGSTGIANMYTFEKTEDGRYIHNQDQLLETKGDGREENLDVFGYEMFDPEKISYEVYVSYRLGELKNMADILSKLPPYNEMDINVVYAYAISVVNDYFKDNYFEDMESWPQLFKVTNSDGLDMRVGRKSAFTLPQPKNSENFVGWYNTFDGKIYLPGESATIYMNTHFIARYSK